jgi:DNA-directed RNA polymerase beta subunit/DNA-directed RNA polymerase beta' subunit
MEQFNHQQAVAKLQTNVKSIFDQYFPYERNDYRFEVKNIHFEDPSISHTSQEQAFLNDASVESMVRGDVEVYHKGHLVKTHRNQILVRIPYPTERGTYIAGGNELVVLNRMSRRNGVYIHPIRDIRHTRILTAEVRSKGSRFEINFDANRAQMKIEKLGDFGKTNPGAIDLFSFLHLLGVTDGEIRQAVNDKELADTLLANSTNASTQKMYSAIFAKEYPGADEAKKQIIDFVNGRLTFDADSQKINAQTIGSPISVFDSSAFLQTISQLAKEYKQPGTSVEPDDFRFKEIKSPEDTVAEFVRRGIKEWINKRLRPITYSDMNEVKKKNLNAKPDQFIYRPIKSLYSSDIAELVDSANPLDVHQKLYKITSVGTGGLNSKSATTFTRNLQDTAFAKIDALETPQSSRMGLSQHFASGAKIKNGRVYSKFYRVHNGKIDTSKIIDTIDPLDEFHEFIAFNTPSELKTDSSGHITSFKNEQVRVRHSGNFITVPRNQVTLIDTSSTAHMSHTMSLIPFSAHDDGARALMGSGMMKQSLNLEHPEAPLVQSISDPITKKTVEEEMAERASYILKSPVSGTVKHIGEHSIDIDTGEGTHKINKLNYFATGKAGGFIHHKPVVKVGDAVQKGDLLADGWQSKNGQLALGKNVQVAYLPFKGYNFEDGVVASQSFVNKMASEEVKPIEIILESRNGTVLYHDPKVVSLLKDGLHVSPALLSKLDANGIIKKGEDVHAGDILVAAVKEKEKEDLTAGQRDLRNLMRGKITHTPADDYKDVSRKAVGYQKGRVINVQVTPTGDGHLKVTIFLLSYKPMELGDKLSGRHGNKGTITKIIPDNQMPHTVDGTPVELIFSPLAVPSRKNPGQLYEINAGLVAQKKGMKVYKVHNFDTTEKDKLMKHLEDIGLPDGKQVLINPDTDKPYENTVTVGPQFIMKLKHKVESKITARNIEGSTDEVKLSPRKTSGSIDGDRHNPQSVGGMEFWSLTSAGAVHNIHDMTTLKSDGAGDKKRRREIFDAIRKGMPVPEPVTPQSVKILSDRLLSAGVQMTPLRGDKEVSLDEKLTELMLNPMKKDHFKRLAKDKVTSAKGLIARTKSFAPGGVYDPEIFGADGSQWARIDLIEPMPNPLFLDDATGPRPYEAMLFSQGLKQGDIKDLVSGQKFIVLDPKESGLKKGELVSLKTLDELQAEGKDPVTDTGGSALSHLLEKVDLKDELTKAESRLKGAKTLAQRSKAEQQVLVLGKALDQQLKPNDFLMDSVPVLPLKYRRPILDGTMFTEDSISKLYNNLIKKNEEYEKFQEAYNGDTKQADRAVYGGLKKDYYEGIKNIIGVGNPLIDDKTGQPLKGIMHSLKSKQGFIRSNMQSKMQDYSGRSVIIVDPLLKLDQVALPEDMASELFLPQVIGELQKLRYSPDQIKHFVANKTQEFRDALERVSKNHPVILNRQPSLHRHSLQAFYPKINWNGDGVKHRAIGLNPIVTTGYNADFDGDTMAVHIPITAAAIKEAEDKLLPSKNLLNPTHNGIITDLKHEMQLGIFYMTRDVIPQGKIEEFSSFKELENAYNKGRVKTYEAVRVNVPGKGLITATAGQHLFNLSLPLGFQDYENNKNVNKGKMEKILTKIINSPNGGALKAVQAINALQTVGFQTATYSGMSIAVKDFDPVTNHDRHHLFQTAEKQLYNKFKDGLASGMLDIREAWEQEKSELAKSHLVQFIKSSIDSDNPVEIMQRSGARANAGQINALAGIIGVGKDVTGQKTRAINSSHLNGLTPDQFWDLAYDSRKGILDKSIESEKPGALTRELWMTNKQTVISERDCGDTQGVWLSMANSSDKKAIHGRVLLHDVPLSQGGMVRVTRRPLTIHEEELITSHAKGKVNVRSPLTCKSTSGVCQMCYGNKPGGVTNDYVPIGTAIGSIAAQALGEPSTQAIMKAFHVGAANSAVSGAFDRIQEALRVPLHLKNSSIEAVIAEEDGTVTDIEHHPITGTVVKIGSKKYKLHHKVLSDFIKVGAHINKGDLITKEFNDNNDRLVIRNPHDVLKFQGTDAARDYIAQAIEDGYRAGGIENTDRRHYEVVTRNMLNRAVIKDPGTSPYTSGQVVPLNVVEKYNQLAGRVHTVAMDYSNRLNVIGAVAAQDYNNPITLKPIVKKGEVITDSVWEQLKNRNHIKVQKKPLQFEQTLSGVSAKDLVNHNWLDSAAYGDARRLIGEAAVLGMKDKLNTPLSRQMTGLKGNFSDGYEPEKEKEKDHGIMAFIHGFL